MQSSPRSGHDLHTARVGNRATGQARVAEEAHRRARADRNQVGKRLERLRHLLGEVRQPRDRRESGAALRAGNEGIREQTRAGPGRDACGDLELRCAQRGAAQQDGGRGVFAENGGRRLDPGARDRCGGLRLDGLRGTTSRVPGTVRRNDQGRRSGGGAGGGRDGVGHVASHIHGAARRPDPVRHRPGQRLDVRCEGGVCRDVPGRLVANHVHDRAARATRVVQVRNAVREAGTEMQQRERRPLGHPRVAVRGSRDYAFEQTQHGAHAGDRIQRGDKVHLRGPGVREAHLDPRIHRPSGARSQHRSCSHL